MPVGNPIASITIDYSQGTYAHVVLGDPYAAATIDIINVPQDATVPADLTILFENRTQFTINGPTWMPDVTLDDVRPFNLSWGDTAVYRLYSADGGITWFGNVTQGGRYVHITGDTMTGQLIQEVDGIVNGITYGQGPGGQGNNSNTVFGYLAFTQNTTGDRNTVFGSSALGANSTGFGNIAIGSSALLGATTANENTVIGALAAANVNDSRNVIVGRKALQTAGTDLQFGATGANDNVILGANAARLADYRRIYNPYSEATEPTTPYNNCIIGSGAAEQLYGVDSSVVIGKHAGRGTDLVSIISQAVIIGTGAYEDPIGSNVDPRGGAGDVAIGYKAMGVSRGLDLFTQQARVSVGAGTGGGISTVAIGAGAMTNSISGHYTVAVGANAGINSTGQNNTFVGRASGTDAVANITTQSNYVVLGNNSTTNANIKVAWTVTSDARDKTDIVPLTLGLDFINQLQPKQFKLMDRDTQEATTGIRYGFLAQDVLAVEGDDPVIIDNSDLDNLKMKESLLVPTLVKAVQELSAKLDAALAKIAVLEAK